MCPAWAGTHQRLDVHRALPLGHVLVAVAGTDYPDVLGAAASDGVANMALGILP